MEDESKRFIVEMMWVLGLVIAVATLPYIGVFASIFVARWLGLGFEETRVLCLTFGLSISTLLLIWILVGIPSKKGKK